MIKMTIKFSSEGQTSKTNFQNVCGVYGQDLVRSHELKSSMKLMLF